MSDIGSRRPTDFSTASSRQPVPAETLSSRPSVSVIVPTYDEAENITILLNRLRSTLDSASFRGGYEIIVVDDDSPDRTWKVAEECVRDDRRVSVIRRTSDRGLASAVLTGMSLATGSTMVVMDGDLQHDPDVIPRLVEPVLNGNHDICVASRTAAGGSFGRFTRARRSISFVGNWLAQLLLGTPCSDPMSGFFAVSRDRYEAVAASVNPRGFKILLELMARRPRPSVAEVGYRFGHRNAGSTKLSSSIVLNYLAALVSLSIGRILPATFVIYLAVGFVGLGLRAVVELTGRFILGPASVGVAIFAAVECGLVVNYLLHNRVTFEPFRHRGVHLARGLISFHVVSAHGLLVHAGVMALMSRTTELGPQLLATDLSPPFILAGALATIGNYHINAGTTWRP